MYIRKPYPNELYHHGIQKQKWGIRRFQNKDGSLTPAGKKRYRKIKRKVDAKKQINNKLLRKVLALAPGIKELELGDVPKSTVAKGKSHYMRMQQIYMQTHMDNTRMFNQTHMQTHMDNTRMFNQTHMNNMNMHMNNMHAMNNINHFHHNM